MYAKPLGDDIGFVELIDFLGSDLTAVNAARVSYGKSSIEYTEKDRKLVRYLMKNHHGTPFEHAVLQFRVRAPLFVVHQWERHRISSYNEESGRYIELRDDFYTPVDVSDSQADRMRMHWCSSFELYKQFLEEGMDKEKARIVLPVSLYKEFWWTVNARALMNFLALRNDPHAQWEIRNYADAIEKMARELFPDMMIAFDEMDRMVP